MAKQLQGKTALVTGGSRGIGAAIAKRLAQEGANIALTYSASPDKAEAVVKEIQKLGVKASAIKSDQADPKSMVHLVNHVMDQFGDINILVANAGVFISGAIDDPNVDLAALERQHLVNVGSVATLVRAAVAKMKPGSRIIVIGSIAGERASMSGIADYSATKAALIGYVRGWSRDLGAKNITVNLIQPGPIDTDMNPQDGDLAKMLMSKIPLGRYGKPEEVAHAVAFIASPEASYITGTALTIDGGFIA